MIFTKRLLPILCISVLFSGCVEKGEMRCVLPETTISSNSPIIAGDQIILKTAEINGATYHWIGPNGFESNLQNPVISKSTADMSGEYKVVASIGICETEELTTEVKVIKNVITCSLSNNRADFTNTFRYQNFYEHGVEGISLKDEYYMRAVNNNCNLDIVFKGSDIPKTGVYSIVSSSTPLTSNTVHVNFSWQEAIFCYGLSGDVSISFSNGKFVATFCDVPFTNKKSTNNQEQFKCSAKFTEY